jgi:hypothetical protein
MILGLSALLAVGGCAAPSARLSFPAAPLTQTQDARQYDLDDDQEWDFALTRDDSGTPILVYRDAASGHPDRVYRRSDHLQPDLPHCIILVDSIPFFAVRDRVEAGGFSWFDPPKKVIAPFPTMSGVIFSQIVGAPPLPSANNRYYDPIENKSHDLIWDRVFGHVNPWQERLDYRAKYWENGMAFLKPRPWFHAELERIHRTVTRSSSKQTIVYLASTSGMLSKYGSEGLQEVLDGLEQLSMQLLYEYRGAIDITIISDHGHNLIEGTRFSAEPILEDAGFNIRKRIDSINDVVLDLDGLVNYFGVHTRQPTLVADLLVNHPEVEFVVHKQGEDVVVRTSAGSATITKADNKYGFTITSGDPFGYAATIASMQQAGVASQADTASSQVWFSWTVDHEYPNVPVRLWNALHANVRFPPDVMVGIRDGHYAGDPSFEKYIQMKSTHGGLNQINSAAVILSTTGRIDEPLESRNILHTLEADQKR